MNNLAGTIAELHTAFQSGLSLSEAMAAHLRTVNAIKSLNAFTGVAENADMKPLNKSGRLNGVPMAVKDNFCTRDFPTTCASAMLRDYQPPFNATVVEKAKQAGAVILGKTNLDEFAMGSGGLDSIYGPAKSIWKSSIPYRLRNKNGCVVHESKSSKSDCSDDWVVAGGSSSGSAVAVSSGACLVGLGSDTGGSVRIPGAWNGISTFKPTYGALSRHGLIPLVNSLDVPGIFARCVDDLVTTYNCIKGCDPKDSTSISMNDNESFDCTDESIKGCSVGIPQEYLCEGMNPEIIEAWSTIADLLENSGFRVKSVSLPHTKYSIVCYSVLNPCEVASNMARYDGLEYGLRSEVSSSTHEMYASSRRTGFNNVVRGRILAGNFFLLRENLKDYFIRAMKVRRLVCQDFWKVWKSVDYLLTPVTLDVAPYYSEFSKLDNRQQATRQDYCTQPVNMAGLPAATVPISLSVDKQLPISLQIIGQRRADLKLLSLAKFIESQVDFPRLEINLQS